MQNFDRNFASRIISKTVIFARMNPQQKAYLIETLKKINRDAKNEEYVIMCGDGANDCLALKAADAGVSLT